MSTYREVRNEIQRNKKIIYFLKVMDVGDFKMKGVKFFLEELKEEYGKEKK